MKLSMTSALLAFVIPFAGLSLGSPISMVDNTTTVRNGATFAPPHVASFEVFMVDATVGPDVPMAPASDSNLVTRAAGLNVYWVSNGVSNIICDKYTNYDPTFCTFSYAQDWVPRTCTSAWIFDNNCNVFAENDCADVGANWNFRSSLPHPVVASIDPGAHGSFTYDGVAYEQGGPGAFYHTDGVQFGVGLMQFNCTI